MNELRDEFLTSQRTSFKSARAVTLRSLWSNFATEMQTFDARGDYTGSAKKMEPHEQANIVTVVEPAQTTHTAGFGVSPSLRSTVKGKSS